MKKSLSLCSALMMLTISMPSFAIITTQNAVNVEPSKNVKRTLSPQELAQMVQSAGQQPIANPVVAPQNTQTQAQQPYTTSTQTSQAQAVIQQQQQAAVTLKNDNVEPKLSLGVFTRRNDAVVPANTNLLSRSNANHRLCWIAFDAIFPNQVDVEENITAPAPSQFSGPNSRTVSSTDGLHHSVFTKLNSANNQIVERCWQFGEDDPLGTYQISIKVGEINYPVQKFQLVK